MLYILSIALLLAYGAAQRTILNATLGDTLQNNTVTNVNFVVQLFESLLPLPIAINQCTKLGLTATKYNKFTCAENGLTVNKYTYTDATCDTQEGDAVVITNTTMLGSSAPYNMVPTSFWCGGDDEYLVVELSTGEDCDPSVPVATAINPCLYTQLSTTSPLVNFKLFCSDDIAQLQVFTYPESCSADSWEYSIEIDSGCGALFPSPIGGGYIYGRVTDCSQTGAYYDEDSAVSASYLIALVISVVAVMLH
jgi:hypothetical protein